MSRIGFFFDSSRQFIIFRYILAKLLYLYCQSFYT